MSTSADAADQVVNMSLQGVKVVAEITGVGAKNIATYLYAVLKDQKRTRGKTRLEGLLRSNKELKVFAVKASDLPRFSKEAKRYGVLYCALRDKKDADGLCDIMVRAEDASKINRIVERFSLATCDQASIKTEIEKARAEKAAPTKDTPAEMQANSSPEVLQGGEHSSDKSEPNPTTAALTKSPPSDATSPKKKVTDEVSERSSIREELRTIKAEQKQKTTALQPDLRHDEKRLRGNPIPPQNNGPSRPKGRPKKERS